jgi:hypothetical protein
MTEHISGVSRSCVLVDLFIATYSGRKQDKRTQEEVTNAKGAASKRAASVYKSLFADCEELDSIIKFQSRARMAHYKQTLPWSDNGSRLLPVSSLLSYKETMNEYEAEFNRLVGKFLDKYDTLVAGAAFQLGTLFDRSEYPTREQVRNRFSFNVATSPLPTSGDFRLDIESEVQRDLADQYERRMTSLVESSMRDAWTRLHAVLSKISDRLTPEEDGKKKIFHETMLTNADELCELLQGLNVMNDPKLETARVKLRNALVGVSAKELREVESARVEVKRSVDEILGQFDWFASDDDAGE